MTGKIKRPRTYLDARQVPLDENGPLGRNRHPVPRRTSRHLAPPQVAIQCTKWCSDAFAVQVTTWVEV
jgi:hypothetical protein